MATVFPGFLSSFWYMLFFGVVRCEHVTPPTDCTVEGHDLHCERFIPTQIPANIYSVLIRNYDDKNINSSMFTDGSWHGIKQIDITVVRERHPFHVLDFAFSSLTDLQSLGIHASGLTDLGIYPFAGLDRLTTLDMSVCDTLDVTKLIPALTSRQDSLSKLTTLILDKLNIKVGDHVTLNYAVLNGFSETNISKLSLHGTNIFLEIDRLPRRSLSVQYLDISNTALFVKKHFEVDIKPVISSLITNLATVNISNIPSRFFGIVNNVGIQNIQKDSFISDCSEVSYINQFQQVYMNNVMDQKTTDINSGSIDVSSCNLSLKTFHFQGNGIRRLNFTLRLPHNNSVTEIILSFNGMEYLSPGFLNSATSLKTLYLSHNSLYKMKDDDFERLLQTFTQLEDGRIDHNGLMSIPSAMFRNNKLLRRLDLSGNFLTTLSFDVKELTNLIILNLQNNRIKFLDGSVLEQLHHFYEQYHVKKDQLRLSLFSNPLVCSCKSVEFVRLIVKIQRDTEQSSLHCTLDGVLTEINENTVDTTTYMCKLTAIIVAITFCCFLLIIVIIPGISYALCIRRRKITQARINNFINNLKLEESDEHLVFIAYVEDDINVVVTCIHKRLDAELALRTEIPRNLICYDITHFRRGYSVFTEMLTCVSNSQVVIFVVSQAFCSSSWGQAQANEACQQNKPMILILFEDINEQMLCPVMLCLFRRGVSTRLTRDNGEYNLQPSWKEISNMVLKLASKRDNRM